MKMVMITDHKTLSRRVSEIRTELDEGEKCLRKLLGGFDKSDRPSLSSEFDKSHATSSCKNLFPQKSIVKRLKDSSESGEENASDDEFPSKKVALRSAIITKLGGVTSRRDLIRKQNCNTKVQSRNRRIFGMVQSTLQKFQDEAVKRQSQDLKKIKIEQKLEAAEEEEKQSIEKQKIELYSKQKEKQLELKCLQEMMEFTESFDIWENNQKYLLNYSMTKATPKICFLPASHTSSSKKHLQKSKTKIQEIMQKQKEAVEKELAKIYDSYQLSTAVVEVTTPLWQDSYQNTEEQMTDSLVIKKEDSIEDSLNLYLDENEMFSE